MGQYLFAERSPSPSVPYAIQVLTAPTFDSWSYGSMSPVRMANLVRSSRSRNPSFCRTLAR